MTVRKTPFSSVLAINGHFLLAFTTGSIAWLIWPTSPDWWGLAVMSIVLGAASVGSIVTALRAMVKVFLREKEIARFAANSRAPEPSDLANSDALKRAGLIDD